MNLQKGQTLKEESHKTAPRRFYDIILNMIAVFIFIIGLSVGSFLNVLIWRIPKGENFIKGGSKCPHCGHILSWRDLIPLASFFFLKRKCRYCRQPISWRYPLIELLTGIIFLSFFFSVFGNQLLVTNYQLPIWLAVISLLIVLVFIDFDYFIISDKILIGLFLISLAEQLFLNKPLSIGRNLLTGGAVGLIFFLVYLATNAYYSGGGMGLGDVKLVGLLGFIFGFPAILPIIYLALAGSLLAAIILILFFKGGLKSKLPFGSFLGGAAIVFIIFNQFFLPTLMPYIFKLYI